MSSTCELNKNSIFPTVRHSVVENGVNEKRDPPLGTFTSVESEFQDTGVDLGPWSDHMELSFQHGDIELANITVSFRVTKDSHSVDNLVSLASSRVFWGAAKGC